MSPPSVTLNCGDCSACCRRELVALVEGDNLSDYPEAKQVEIEGLRDALPSFLGSIIPNGSDGACVYLKDGKCSIYDKRPRMCRAFSCVGLVERILANTTRYERRRTKTSIDRDVWRAGMRLRREAAS